MQISMAMSTFKLKFVINNAFLQEKQYFQLGITYFVKLDPIC